MKSKSERTALQRRILNKRVGANQMIRAGMPPTEATILFAGTPVVAFDAAFRAAPVAALTTLPVRDLAMVTKYLSHNLGQAIPAIPELMFNAVVASADAATPAHPWRNPAALRVVACELMLNAIMAALYAETENENAYLPDDPNMESVDNAADVVDMPLETAVRAGYVYARQLQPNMKSHHSTFDDAVVNGSTVKVNVITGEIKGSAIIH